MIITKITALTEANQRLAQCLMYDGKDKLGIPLLKGKFWNMGYFREGVDVETAVTQKQS